MCDIREFSADLPNNIFGKLPAITAIIPSQIFCVVSPIVFLNLSLFSFLVFCYPGLSVIKYIEILKKFICFLCHLNKKRGVKMTTYAIKWPTQKEKNRSNNLKSWSQIMNRSVLCCLRTAGKLNNLHNIQTSRIYRWKRETVFIILKLSWQIDKIIQLCISQFFGPTTKNQRLHKTFKTKADPILEHKSCPSRRFMHVRKCPGYLPPYGAVTNVWYDKLNPWVVCRQN